MEILIPESPVCYKKTEGCPTPKLQKLDDLWHIAQLVGTADFDAEYYVSSQSEFGSLMNLPAASRGVSLIDSVDFNAASCGE